MKAIIWLGNPDKKYEFTRHNVGFLFVDWLREIHASESVWREKFAGHACTLSLFGEPTILLKPMTYMNLSGKSVCKMVDFYDLSPEDIIIVSDDVDMEFARVRYRAEGSAWGHRGLADIFTHLHTTQVPRIKIGIGRDPAYETSDWVLSRFSESEISTLHDDIFSKVISMLEQEFF